MTCATTGIGERSALLGDEEPFIRIGKKRKLENPERFVVAHLAVVLRRTERAQILATGADHKFTHAAWDIGLTLRILRREAFVVVVVAVNHHVGSGIVKGLPKWVHF